MEKFKVSVIIPVFNGEKFLEKCIKSLKEQTINFKNIEVILVNDCSTDNTEDILNDLSQKYNNCKVFNLEKNSGSASIPVNIGIGKASSDFIMFLDCDDTYTENMCEVMYNTIIETDVDFVMCNHYELINGKSIIKKSVENLEQTIYNPKKDLEIFEKIFRWDKIFNRNFIINNNIKSPEHMINEDVAFSLSSYLSTNKIIYLKNFYGYIYTLAELGGTENLSSVSRTISQNSMENAINGLYVLYGIIKNKKRFDVVPIVIEHHLRSVLTSFVLLTEVNSIKLKLLNKIYVFEENLEVPIIFKEKWAQFLNNLILKKRFRIVIIFSNFIKLLYNSNFIKQIHRTKFQKKN